MGLETETLTHTLLGASPLRPPPRTAGVRTGVGSRSGGGAGPLPGRPGRGCRAAPAERVPPPHKPGLTHLLRATVKLSCAGCREPSPPRAGRQLGTPGRRLSGRRAPSQEGSLAPPGLRRAGGAARRDAVRVGRSGAASRAHPPARPSPPPCSPTPRAGPQSLAPAGPVSGQSAEDPPPGAALRLLRRMRRRLLLPASRPPWRPPGTLGPSPAGEAR